MKQTNLIFDSRNMICANFRIVFLKLPYIFYIETNQIFIQKSFGVTSVFFVEVKYKKDEFSK